MVAMPGPRLSDKTMLPLTELYSLTRRSMGNTPENNVKTLREVFSSSKMEDAVSFTLSVWARTAQRISSGAWARQRRKAAPSTLTAIQAWDASQVQPSLFSPHAKYSGRLAKFAILTTSVSLLTCVGIVYLVPLKWLASLCLHLIWWRSLATLKTPLSQLWTRPSTQAACARVAWLTQ